jgi:hypothetical protein
LIFIPPLIFGYDT